MGKFASGLLNYVESVNINGYKKTVFYSEFATNLVVGDKVFIVNGNYDSDLLISENNLTSGTDGYTVLDIDRCRITLDINYDDYNGILPYDNDILDNYIKVYNITSQQEFDYINTLTINSYNNHILSKFENGLSNNVIYANSEFVGNSSVIDSYTGVINSGFYQKITLAGSPAYWAPISLLSGSIPFTTIGTPTYSLINNGKLLILGKDDIVIGSNIFKSRGIYTFNNLLNKWEFDILSNKPYISKLNFRHGIFKGTWNDGVFGTYLDEIDWYGNNARWNSGIFINSNWKNGTLYSKTDTSINANLNSNTSLYAANFTETTVNPLVPISTNIVAQPRVINYNSINSSNNLNTNYYCYLNSNGLPIQTSDYSNNNSYGFNYVIDSNIEQANIINGNFKNCNIGLTSYGINSLDVYYGLSFSYNLNIKGGYYELCDINTSLFSNSSIKNSNILNSNISTTRLSSNQIDNTIAQGTYNSDNGITVINADLWSYLTNSGSKRGILKLFISDEDLIKIEDFEVIYIDKIKKEIYLKSFNDENKVYINIENKYIFDYFNNTELSSDPIIISRKNINENLYKTYINFDGLSFTTQYTLNQTKYSSIDIDLGIALAYYINASSGIITYLNPSSLITINNVSNLFSNTILNNSSFNSGLLLNSTWESGDNFNNISNQIQLSGNNLAISFITGTTNSLYVNVSNNIYNQYDKFNIGDYIWLNGINYTDPYSTVTNISGTYKIFYIDTTYTSYRQLELIEITNTLSGLTTGGTFSVLGVLPNYVSVNKFKIDNSIIQSGLFKTSLIQNSTIFNSGFDNTDQNLTINNINKLRFINTLVNNDNNIIQSGYFYKSHIIVANWQNAISYNNIWYGATFTNGVFNNGYWLNGPFNNGYFINSDDISTTLPSYDNYLSGYYRSWRYGEFNNGQFYKSTWIDGVFNNGRLFNSNWYGGIWNNGILGLKNSPYLITTMGYYSNLGVGATQTYWYNGTVESATIGGSSSIYWYQGTFNDGEFTSFGNGAESIWYKGSFNGGKFDGLAKWKNGIFNNGKFTSYYGCTLSNISHYSTNISNPGYGFAIGDTFSVVGGDGTETGIITSVSNASGLTINIQTVGNITGSGFVFNALTVDSAGHILTSTASTRGVSYTVGELFTINNTFSVAPAYGKITAIDGSGGVIGYTLSFVGLSYTNSTTYSTTVYSGSNGPIANIAIDSSGIGYIVGDNFIIYHPPSTFGFAQGQVLSVGSIGNVLAVTISAIGSIYYTSSNTYATGLLTDSIGHILSYNITNRGSGYAVGTYSTIPSYLSTGTNFIINIASLDTYIDIANASWENGIFNGGQFGLASTTNSVWYNGQFNGGIFSGKIWNYGVFTNGQFNGSSLTSSYKNEMNFVNSYVSNYYGVWLDGYVVTQPHIGNSTQKVYTELLRATDTKKIKNSVILQNMLWLGGTFSHDNGIMYNSVWLDGTFNGGQFNYSTFNPFVDQNLSGSTTSLAFNFNNSCVWLNGTLNNSTFYISEWQNGVFNSGYMLGGVWRKGTWNYGTAENIYWESGLWRNGNWFGSNFGISTVDQYTLNVTDAMVQSVLYNVALASNNNSIHLMNVFTGSSPEILFSPDMSNSLGWDNLTATQWHQSSTYSQTTYDITGYYTIYIGSLAYSVPIHAWVSHIYTSYNYTLSHVGNYSSLTPISSNLLYGVRYDTTIGYTDNIFVNNAAYTIKVDLNIDYPTNMNNPVYIDLWMGYTVSTFTCTKGINPTLVKSYTDAEVFYWTAGNTYTKFGIGKRSTGNSSPEEVSILNVTVNETLISYDPVYNNQLYNIYGVSASPSLSATLSLPTNITLTSDIGVGLNYGNGMFYSGIWENGIWENGYRDDETLTYCDLYSVASYIKIDRYTHRVQLQFLNNSTLSPFNLGDYVSVGNLIGIDVNGQRKLLKDKFRVVYVDINSIVLEYILTSPILEITKDSQNHLIYISKNIWLSGGFLCGYFSGIWNYGLFKGYPYITKMQDSHWVDGIFDGGHFVSTIATVSNYLSTTINYNTGLIQNFTFKDNNIGNINSPLYLSWIDVNYSTQSYVNINRPSSKLATIGGSSTITSFFTNIYNLYGYPTNDIMDSSSYFMNSYSSDISNYRLGYKQTIYQNFIPDNGNFTTPFSNTASGINLNNLFNLGFTYSTRSMGYVQIQANIDETNIETLSITGSNSWIFINNTNIVPTKNRYYQSSITFTDTPESSFMKFAQDSSIDSFDLTSVNNLTKTQYYYNNQGLNLYAQSIGGPKIALNISNISYYELDMIPFFQYATESNIDQTIYYPYTAVAPYIDYSNSSYNYVGNIVLTIDVNTIGNSGSVYNPANSGNIFNNISVETMSTLGLSF